MEWCSLLLDFEFSFPWEGKVICTASAVTLRSGHLQQVKLRSKFGGVINLILHLFGPFHIILVLKYHVIVYSGHIRNASRPCSGKWYSTPSVRIAQTTANLSFSFPRMTRCPQRTSQSDVKIKRKSINSAGCTINKQLLSKTWSRSAYVYLSTKHFSH